MEPFIGQMQLFPYNFAPRGWAFCHGQMLAITDNNPLFSLIGTIYGGDGRTTFALPDLRGRVPIGAGHGPGLSEYRLGETGSTALEFNSNDDERLFRKEPIINAYVAMNWCIALEGIFPSRN